MRTSSEGVGGKLRREDLRRRVFDPGELESGVVLNAAVILEDPEEVDETIKAIEAPGEATTGCRSRRSAGRRPRLHRADIGGGQAVLTSDPDHLHGGAGHHQQRAGDGHAASACAEIGTLRAVGAQRRFILAMLMIEALVVGHDLRRRSGAGMGALVVAGHRQGRASRRGNDIWSLLLLGAAPAPVLGNGNVIRALVIVILVSAVSSSTRPGWRCG